MQARFVADNFFSKWHHAHQVTFFSSSPFSYIHRLSDCCLMPIQQFVRYIMARTS